MIVHLDDIMTAIVEDEVTLAKSNTVAVTLEEGATLSTAALVKAHLTRKRKR